MKLEFYQQIWGEEKKRKKEKTQILNFINIWPAEAELFYADIWTNERTDGRTHRYDKANSHLSQFCECA
jgi:hypothetical protein